MISLFPVALVTTIVLTSTHYSSGHNIPPADDTLQYVYAIFRHGPRSPKYKYYPSHITTAENTLPFTGTNGKLLYPGSLTNNGKRKMYQVGQNLALRYGSFLGQYVEGKVWTSARASSRCIMSALTMLAGLFPPYPKIFKDIGWQPIPVWGLSEDKSGLFHDLTFKNLHLCPNYQLLAVKVKETVLDKTEAFWQRLKMYEIVKENTGTSVNSLSTLFPIYDTLQAEDTNGIRLPDWATQVVPRVGKLLYPDMMREAIDSWYKTAVSRQLLTYQIGPVFNKIYEQFKAKAAKFDSGSKMNLHVTEDTTIIALLTRLGLAASASYDPGHGIIFELHYDNTDITVKILSYDSNTHTMKELETSYCRQPCTLEKFMKLNSAVSLAEWDKNCVTSKTN